MPPFLKEQLPPWGVVAGPDDVVRQPGRAERELESAILHGKWKDLEPRSRLWVLRSCALDNSRWAEFTPRCQMWVLRELGQLFALLEDEATTSPPRPGSHKAELAAQALRARGADLKLALSQTRLPRLVSVDPKRARELAGFCEGRAGLKEAVATLQSELDARERKRQREAAGVSPRSSGVNFLPRMVSASSLKDGKERSAGRQARVSAPTRSQSEATIKGRGTRTAPAAVSTESAAAAARVASKPLSPGLGAAAAARVASKAQSPEQAAAAAAEDAAEAERAEKPLEATGGDAESQQAVSEASVQLDPTAPRVVVAAESISVGDTDKSMSRTCFSIVPMRSKEWRRLRAEEERQRVACNTLSETLETLRSRSKILLDKPRTASLHIDIPKRAPHISAMTKACLVHGSEPQRIAEADERVIYEARIPSNTSVNGLSEDVKAAFGKAGLKEWELRPRWALEIAQAELKLAFPQYDLDIEELQALAQIAMESNNAYAEAWDVACKSEVKDSDRVLARDSKSTFAGLLLQPDEAKERQLQEDCLLQGAQNLEELLADAAHAQWEMKRLLGRKSDWATTDMNDREALPESDEARQWRAPMILKYLAPGSICRDPGLMPQQEVEAKARALMYSYECGEVPVREVMDVARVHVVCDSLELLRMCLDQLFGKLEGNMVWFENGFKNPSVFGVREIAVGLRLCVPVPADPDDDSDEDQATAAAPAADGEATEEAPAAEDVEAAEGDTQELSPAPAPTPPASDGGAGDDAAEAEGEAVTRRWHNLELRLSLQAMRSVEEGAASFHRQAFDAHLLQHGVQEDHVEAVRELLLRKFELTDGRLACAPLRELDRTSVEVRRIYHGLRDRGKGLARRVVEAAAQLATAAGAPEILTSPLVTASTQTDEEAEAGQAERRKKAKEQDERLAEEAREKAEQEPAEQDPLFG